MVRCVRFLVACDTGEAHLLVAVGTINEGGNRIVIQSTESAARNRRQNLREFLVGEKAGQENLVEKTHGAGSSDDTCERTKTPFTAFLIFFLRADRCTHNKSFLSFPFTLITEEMGQGKMFATKRRVVGAGRREPSRKSNGGGVHRVRLFFFLSVVIFPLLPFSYANTEDKLSMDQGRKNRTSFSPNVNACEGRKK